MVKVNLFMVLVIWLAAGNDAIEKMVFAMVFSQSYQNWWRPLPVWLKVATAFFAYPAWFLIVYCVLAGQAKSIAALLAFGVVAIIALMHIVFDDRNRRGAQEHHGELDLSSGE